MRWIRGVAGAMLLALASGGTARAQAAPAAAPATEKKLDEARERYQRGTQLYAEGNYEGARAEFERAYQLAPANKVLYNLGMVHEQLGDYVQASTTLKRYLDHAGTEADDARRAEVTKELWEARSRIAKVAVKINVTGAALFIDDACPTDVTTGVVNCEAIATNQREIFVNPGRHRVTVRRDGYESNVQVLTFAGSDQVEVTVTLKANPKGGVVRENNPWTIPTVVGWSATGAAAIATVVFGVLSIGAKNSQNDKLSKFGTSADDLKSARDKTQTLSTGTDVLFVTAAVFAGVSTFFTLKMLRAKPSYEAVPKDRAQNRLDLNIGLNGFAATGTF